jgi:hypothetical protein
VTNSDDCKRDNYGLVLPLLIIEVQEFSDGLENHSRPNT